MTSACRTPRLVVAASVLCAGLAAACLSPDEATPAASSNPSTLWPPDGLGLQTVALPDFSLMKAPAREQMQARFSTLKSSIENRSPPRDELGAAYGEMGKLLMAATYLDAAESCYLNAQALAPSDRRWPYYLGHVYKVRGPLAKSVVSFEQALRLQPNDVPTLVWLGEAHLADGRPETAEALFAKALALEPDSVAARFGRGRAALARKDHARAATDLEEALARDSRATAIHYPLAMAYRGLGDVERAQAHLARQGTIEARLADPLMRELDDVLQSPEAYNVRGGRDLDAGNWAAAAESFRKGLELAPADASLRHRLGTALFQMGDARGATEQFELVLRSSPRHSRTHFSLGVLSNADGRHSDAIAQFSAALKYEPGYIQARVQLAGALARSGRPLEALPHYERALEADPTLADAKFEYAMAFVRLRRYQEARDRLVDAMKAHADQLRFSHALARLLAAAPDDRVRDGQTAKKLVDDLLTKQQSIELAETTAMMLAELGQYRQAAIVQRDVLAAADRAGLRDVVRRVSENLKLYERGQPCRTPFTDDELP